MAETLYLTPAGTPPLSPVQAPRKRKSVAREPAVKEDAVETSKTPKTRVPKTNLTKSRNGCHTCKAKRLKCDETKPTCNKCARRHVECEGYKKEFKWKGFPEQNIGRKLSKPKRQSSDPTPEEARHLDDGETISTSLLNQALQACTSGNSGATSHDPKYRQGIRVGPDAEVSESVVPPDSLGNPCRSLDMTDLAMADGVRTDGSDAAIRPHDKPTILGHSCDTPFDIENLSQRDFPDDLFNTDFSSQELGLLSPVPEELSMALQPYLNGNFDASLMSLNSFDAANAIQTHHSDTREAYSQPTLPPTFPVQFDQAISTSSEALIHRFFTSTCSVMSIFPITTPVGAQQNPWQTLIWPLVRTESQPMLFHALMSMACFHNYQSQPSLRLEGMTHMRKAVDILHAEQQWLHAPIEVTAATCMALAFSESWMCWKRNIKSGSSHIKTAKQCLMHALKQGAQTRMQKKQLRFLCKTYLYADVIARLTSVDDDVENDAFDEIAAQVLGLGHGVDDRQRQHRTGQVDPSTHKSGAGSMPMQLDPLMGSASTLFPIIGHVANLVRAVYQSKGSTLSNITKAQQLRSQLESWSPPPVNVEMTELHENSTLTAEAYRLATLLHLYQSVPELLTSRQSLSTLSSELGMRILSCIARVPPTSSTIIVQIYPLLVGGCETTVEEDRQWVRNRWRSMEGRMGIGNVEKAREVVEGVWSRRHEASFPTPTAPSLQTGQVDDMLVDDSLFNAGIAMTEDFSFDDIFGSSPPATYNTPKQGQLDDQQLTVRGNLHWVGVMRDWGWEVLLG